MAQYYLVNVSRNIAEQEGNIVETSLATFTQTALTGDVMVVVNTSATVNKDEIIRCLDAATKGIVQSVLLAG